jgi:hypothetical protein
VTRRICVPRNAATIDLLRRTTPLGGRNSALLCSTGRRQALSLGERVAKNPQERLLNLAADFLIKARTGERHLPAYHAPAHHRLPLAQLDHRGGDPPCPLAHRRVVRDACRGRGLGEGTCGVGVTQSRHRCAARTYLSNMLIWDSTSLPALLVVSMLLIGGAVSAGVQTIPPRLREFYKGATAIASLDW